MFYMYMKTYPDGFCTSIIASTQFRGLDIYKVSCGSPCSMCVNIYFWISEDIYVVY
jgi:hypothetical protein